MTTLQERFNKWLFSRAARAVLETPSVAPGDNGFMALSMVHHRDVTAYLLAIKSFALQARPARITVVADPTLDAADQALLRRHIPHIEILPAQSFRRAAIPVGGCWERLAAIAALNDTCSIVQVDADTLSTGPLDDVVQAAQQGRSFILRSEAGVEIVTLERAAELGRQLLQRSGHIQPTVEARMDDLPGHAECRYARGCAGFTGFGRGALTPERLDCLSVAMRGLHGKRWDEWGTEQVASNLLAASAADASMLPHPVYCNADSWAASTRLTHYIGYARYTSRRYEQQARRVVAALRGRSTDNT